MKILYHILEFLGFATMVTGLAIMIVDFKLGLPIAIPGTALFAWVKFYQAYFLKEEDTNG